jgi:CDP-glycerol glycerophosphotransferase (TagB/SpsB family)
MNVSSVNSLEVLNRKYKLEEVFKEYLKETVKENAVFFVSKECVVFYGEIHTFIEFKNLIKSKGLSINDCNFYIFYKSKYVDYITFLINQGAENLFVVGIHQKGMHETIRIRKNIIEKVKNNERVNTITFHYCHAGDSNVHAVFSHVPKKYREKYNFNIIKGDEYKDYQNKVEIPLISSMYISGQGAFINFYVPGVIYNFELGHGAVPFKCCGDMSYVDVWYQSHNHYSVLDKLCVSSELDMVLVSSFSGLERDKFAITGLPRLDTLHHSNGRANLEKVLNTSLEGKKVIINMPTFHFQERAGRTEGDTSLNSYVKMKNFDYNRFDKFLGENNIVCVTKVHYLEEKTIMNSKDGKNLKNMFPISNETIEKHGFDLYELLNAGDMLITDYSSVYGDFLYMEKPTVFVTTDLEDYRNNRGITLEPYEYWALGDKVLTQDELEKSIVSTFENDVYKEERKRLKEVYHKHADGKACERIWELIDEVFDKSLNEKNQELRKFSNDIIISQEFNNTNIVKQERNNKMSNQDINKIS